MTSNRIWVNGGSRGLGKDLVEYFSAKNKLVLLTSYPLDLNSSEKVSVIDKNNLHTLQDQIEDEITRTGFPDIIFHTSGGGFGIKETFVSVERFRAVLLKNLEESLEINRALASSKPKNLQLKIVHIGSIAGGQSVGSVAYNVSKSALSSYVRSAGNEAARENIIIFGVNLGAFYTEENAMARLEKNNETSYHQFISQRLPWQKMMTFKDIAPLFTFFVENDVYYLSGSMIPLDAGEGEYYV
jgi:NAD(P)-dependent dehydrogenase (short-subunit alcohol dehydrogenase family)